MSHLTHLQQNKKNLELRFQILKLIREWFWEQGFMEVEAPTIVKLPGQELNLSPMKINIHDERGQEFGGYLHTSPEYTMKKMLAAGWNKIFYLGKCFRDQESFGGTHNPEFTMLEWYRVGVSYEKLMEDTQDLCNYIIEKLRISNFKFQILKCEFERVSMKELWAKFVNVNLDDYLDEASMLKLCKEKGYNASENESYEELFYRIFLNQIEPELAKMGAVIVYNYPAKMASLSQLAKDDNKYAERFEAYVNGLELCNVFSELTDAQEQKKRLEAEIVERRAQGKDVFDIDKEFIEALEVMPKAAGGALGVDRLIMYLGGLQEINNVITLPASKLFNS